MIAVRRQMSSCLTGLLANSRSWQQLSPDYVSPPAAPSPCPSRRTRSSTRSVGVRPHDALDSHAWTDNNHDGRQESELRYKLRANIVVRCYPHVYNRTGRDLLLYNEEWRRESQASRPTRSRLCPIDDVTRSTFNYTSRPTTPQQRHRATVADPLW